MRNVVRIVTLIAIFHCLAPSAFADLSIRLSNEQLTAGSDAIVIGRAIARQSRWIDRTLVTAVTVQINENLKGDVAGTVEVLLPGGVDANRRIPIGMTFPGAPQMQANEEMFLFLTFDSDVNGYVVSGFAQGKFSIVTQQGRQMISRDLRGSQLVEGTGISRGTATLTPLADFQAEIAGYVNR